MNINRRISPATPSASSASFRRGYLIKYFILISRFAMLNTYRRLSSTFILYASVNSSRVPVNEFHLPHFNDLIRLEIYSKLVINAEDSSLHSEVFISNLICEVVLTNVSNKGVATNFLFLSTEI